MKYLKILAFSFMALIHGFIGLSLLFSDPSGGESFATRIVITTLFFFLGGAAIGFFKPDLWMMSALTAWSGILMGGLLVLAAIRRYGADAFSAQEPPYISAGLIMVFLPVASALIGGYFGKIFRQRRAKHAPSEVR